MTGATGSANAFGTGGNGGPATGNDEGGAGGAGLATAIADLATGPIAANATAAGGTGGDSTYGNGGGGGGASATASALTSGGGAFATADATGGAPGVGGLGAVGGDATATATAAGSSGLAAANAATLGNAPLFDVAAHATGTVAGAITVQAMTTVGGGVPALITPFNNTMPNAAFAIGSGLPSSASLDAALVGHPTNAALWELPNSFVAGTGLLGAVFPATGSIGTPQTFDTSVDFTFEVPGGKGVYLDVGLLNGTAFNASAFNSAVDSLVFSVTDNATTILSDSFTSLTQAVNFFTDDLLSFDPLFGTNTIGLDLTLTASDDIGFEGNFVVGTAVPEPGTLAIFLTALLSWFGLSRRKRRKAAGEEGWRPYAG